MPGALSAFGILMSDVVKDYSRTVLWRTRDKNWQKRAALEFAKSRRHAARDFAREHWTGRIAFTESLDLRYRGQGYELNVPFGGSVLDDFHAEHKHRYGYSHGQREV